MINAHKNILKCRIRQRIIKRNDPFAEVAKGLRYAVFIIPKGICTV